MKATFALYLMYNPCVQVSTAIWLQPTTSGKNCLLLYHNRSSHNNSCTLSKVLAGLQNSIDRMVPLLITQINRSKMRPDSTLLLCKERRLNDGHTVLHSTLMILSIVWISAYVHLYPTILQHVIFYYACM